MKCNDIHQKLAGLVNSPREGELNTDVQAHLRQCEGCQREMFQLKQTWNLLDEAEEIQPSAGFHSRLMERIQQVEVERKITPWRYGLSVAAAACLFLMLGLGLYYYTSKTIPTHQEITKRTNPDQDLAKEFRSLGINARQAREIVDNLEMLKHMRLLEKREFLENIDILPHVVSEEVLNDENR